MSQFTKTVKQIIPITDGELANGAYISVVPEDADRIQLVIGAEYKHGSAMYFYKTELAELIAVLNDIHEAMIEDSYD